MNGNNKNKFARNLISYILLITLAVVGFGGSLWTTNVYRQRVELNEEQAVDNLCINSLLLGVDKEGYRTDVIIFAQLDVAKGTLNMLQIPRDTYVDGVRRANKKINGSYFVYKDGAMQRDIENVYKEVEMLTGLRADNFLLVDTAGFRKIIDAMGGVYFDVPQRMLYSDPEQELYIDLQPGPQFLNGDKAEQLVRFRRYADGDIGRVKVQKEFIGATLDKVFSASSVFNLPDLVDIFSDSCETSFSSEDMYKFGFVVMGVKRENINILTLEGVAEYRNGISYYIANNQLNNQVIDEYFTR